MRCGVKATAAALGPERLGHIELQTPVVHPWFCRRGRQTRKRTKAAAESTAVALLIDIPQQHLDAVIDYAAAVITSVDDARRDADLPRLTAEMTAERQRLASHRDRAGGPSGEILDQVWHTFVELAEKQLVTDPEVFDQLVKRYGAYFSGGWGAPTICTMLQAVDAEAAARRGSVRVHSRLEILAAFESSGISPSCVVLDVVPVIGPRFRGMAYVGDTTLATSDLDSLYRRVINRNNRLKRLIALDAPASILRNEQQKVQQSVDALLDNAQSASPVTGPGGRRLQSLSDRLGDNRGLFGQPL